MINVVGVVYGPQHFSDYVSCAPRLVFSILNTTVASIHESCVSMATASTYEG